MSSEGPDVYKDWILNIIDQLRKRKARPDLERICHFVERRYGLDRASTEAHVEKLVDQGVVIKVVYKRGTSYRNATKSRKKSYGSNVLNSKSASKKIIEAVESIISERSESKQNINNTSVDEFDPNSTPEECAEHSTIISRLEKEGVNARDIENWISSNRAEGDQSEPFMCPIRVVIQREVDAGRLVKLENGNYIPRSPETANKLPEPVIRPIFQKSVSVVSKRGRPPKRKHFPIGRSLSCGDVQPSPYRPESQVAPVPIMPPHLCDFCQQPAERNTLGHEEELLFCKDCNAKAHPSCMQYSPELAKRARNTAWQCIDCKTCCICSDPGEADCMLFCDACDKGYHMLCHDPKVTVKPQGKWVCEECVLDGVDIDEIDDNNCTHVVVDSTVRSTDSESISSRRSRSYSDKDVRQYMYDHRRSLSPPPRKYIKEDRRIEEKYPYVGNWTINEITNFFKKKGFEEQADAFEQQEIDGQSLLLLKRSDVLTGLALKLGPALKIYNIVMKLQSQTST